MAQKPGLIHRPNRLVERRDYRLRQFHTRTINAGLAAGGTIAMVPSGIHLRPFGLQVDFSVQA